MEKDGRIAGMTTADAELIAALREVLAAAADTDRAVAMRAYMKSEMPYLGVGAPVLRAAVRPVLAAHPLPDEETWRATVLALWDGATYREERYVALALVGHRLYHEHRQVHTLELYEHLIRSGAWWDVVDETACPHLPARHQGPVRPGAAGGRHRGQPRRIHAANPALSPYGRELFVRKAIGWALRDHARTDPDWVRGFVEAHRSELSGLSRREALKHL